MWVRIAKEQSDLMFNTDNIIELKLVLGTKPRLFVTWATGLTEELAEGENAEKIYQLLEDRLNPRVYYYQEEE